MIFCSKRCQWNCIWMGKRLITGEIMGDFSRLSIHDAHMILNVFKCVKRNDRCTHIILEYLQFSFGVLYPSYISQRPVKCLMKTVENSILALWLNALNSNEREQRSRFIDTAKMIVILLHFYDKLDQLVSFFLLVFCGCFCSWCFRCIYRFCHALFGWVEFYVNLLFKWHHIYERTLI